MGRKAEYVVRSLCATQNRELPRSLRRRRPEIEAARRAISELQMEGIATTAPLFLKILDHSDFCAGEIDTGFIDRYFTPR